MLYTLEENQRGRDRLRRTPGEIQIRLAGKVVGQPEFSLARFE
jgi:hypothetical protein